MTDTTTPASRLLCLCCGAEVDNPGNLNGCPACGCRQHVPADLADTITITLTKHELRVLTFWAAQFAASSGGHGPAVVRTVVDRLGTQTDAPLSFSQEIADLRAEPSVSNVRIYRDGKLTDQ